MSKVCACAAAAAMLSCLFVGCASAHEGDPNGESEEAATAGHKKKCGALTERILSAEISPPASFGAFNLAAGNDARGLQIEEADADHCGTAVPTGPEGNFGYRHFGYRGVQWGGPDGFSLWYNLESHVIGAVEMGSKYAGTVRFRGRDGGAFGAHAYEIGNGRVLRDGAPLTIQWDHDPNAPEVDELVDGLIATFMPNLPAITSQGCRATNQCLIIGDPVGEDWSRFDARDLHLSFFFKKKTNQLTGVRSDWPGGTVDCTTPQAAHEMMFHGDILPGGRLGLARPFEQLGPWIADFDLTVDGRRNAKTVKDVDALECNGASVASPDRGYGAMQWGPNGELFVEFNETTNLVYKVVAREGYEGVMVVDNYEGTTTFSLTIGKPTTRNGALHTFDWATPASFTEFSNTMTGNDDLDCASAGSCVVTADDGAGHSVVAIPEGLMEVAFEKGTNVPTSITAISLEGK